MKKSFMALSQYATVLLCGSLLIYSCKKETNTIPKSEGQTPENAKTAYLASSAMPADTNATQETIHLFQYLYGLKNTKILFGHEDELIIGSKHYKYKGGSDTYDMIKDYPALYGYDLSNLEQNEPVNNANISFDSIRTKVKQIYTQGGIVTLSWSVDNPVDPSQGNKGTGVQNTISKLFANQTYLNRYKTWLDRLAVYFKSLKTSDGTLIPVIFRPFHECNGSWFWWGKGADKNTPQEFIHLYQFTIDYLRNTKHVHNLLNVYCTGRFKTEQKFLERYPGDKYVDVLGIDVYDKKSYYPNSTIADDMKNLSGIITSVAQTHNKICAIAETGMQGMPEQGWWTNTLWYGIKNSGVSYVMVWGNYGKASSAYFGTFKGQLTESNFKTFAAKSKMTFLSSLSNTLVYQ